MNYKEMDRVVAHFNKYFQQRDPMILHPVVDAGEHIDILLYEPNEKYPFWKLVTMGASDYRMPKVSNPIARRNEYIMFVSKDEDLNDRETLNWYRVKLLTVATFASENKCFISYGHSFEWTNDDADDEMVGAYIEFPQVIESVGVLRCKINVFDTSACLQVVLLNRGELDKLLQIGSQSFSEYLYPENGERGHFLSERHRSEKF